MRRIDRGQAPRSLAVLLALDPDRKWDSSGEQVVHERLSALLQAVQDRVCAYCERPLAAPASVRIEHVHPKSKPSCQTRMSSNHHYDWLNLLAVCCGHGTCDEPKADADLCALIYLPDDLAPDSRPFSFDTLTGGIRAGNHLDPTERETAERTIELLRLDDPDLRESRKALIVEIQRRVIEESDPLAQVRHDLLEAGFPSAVDFVLESLA
jgi:uncharacterized protein (TIGR02646 family)